MLAHLFFVIFLSVIRHHIIACSHPALSALSYLCACSMMPVCSVVIGHLDSFLPVDILFLLNKNGNLENAVNRIIEKPGSRSPLFGKLAIDCLLS